MNCGRCLLLLVLLSGMWIPAGLGAEPAKETPAERADVSVSGRGWWNNRALRKTLKLLESEDQPLVRIDAAFVEDAVVILQSALERDGFLRPSGTVVVRDAGKVVGNFAWRSGEVPAPPRDLDGDEVEFQLEPGIRYRFAELTFNGLNALSDDTARGFFIEEGFLLGGAGSRRFTPAILQRGIGNLREQLHRMGYAEARVEVAGKPREEPNGAVYVGIEVTEGPRFIVDLVKTPSDMPERLAKEFRIACDEARGSVWSRLWQQDFLQTIRLAGYELGYAQIEAGLIRAGETRSPGEVHLSYQLEVFPGPKVTVGEVSFEGGERTQHSVLERAISVKTGDTFVRGDVESDRVRLGALGIFSSVNAEVDPMSRSVWNLNYRLRPGKRLEASVLGGYGSYEQFRVGLELFHADLFGRAHRGRMQLIQSFKSTSGDYLYSVPQIFGTVTDASVRIFGLAREEVSFDRREVGSSVGLRRHIQRLGADAAVRYQFESVSADVFDNVVVDNVPTDSRVASVSFDLTRDRRDNPITPRRGAFLALTLETAARAIGGEVDYQRLDLRGSWHWTVDDGRWLHLGFRHGVLAAFGSASDDIPLAKRFFPGGENSIRGFREGRAAPRNQDGLTIGAEVSSVLNLEFEQALTKSFSMVAFVDAGLTGRRVQSWPGKELRVSAGLGLRYNNLIAPIRLEYGHNIVKEDRDQIGELHFALGFPF